MYENRLLLILLVTTVLCHGYFAMSLDSEKHEHHHHHEEIVDSPTMIAAAEKPLDSADGPPSRDNILSTVNETKPQSMTVQDLSPQATKYVEESSNLSAATASSTSKRAAYPGCCG